MEGYNTTETGFSYLMKTLNWYEKPGYFLVLSACALVLIMIFGKRKGRTVFVYPFLIMAASLYNPYVFPYIFGQKPELMKTYYQAFYLVPCGCLVAAAAVFTASRMKKKVFSVLTVLVFTLAVILAGSGLEISAVSLASPLDWESDSTEITSMIRTIRQDGGQGELTVSFEDSLLSAEVRSMDAGIEASDYLSSVLKKEELLSGTDLPDYYVVAYGGDYDSLLKKAGAEEIGKNKNYAIYRAAKS